MDIAGTYEVTRTAEFIRCGNFSRVALQFPDELLKDSIEVERALKAELGRGVRLYVMADTLYGSCCVDEVAAAHVDAQCVVHYGHACMSSTSNLPALFIFGKAALDVNLCCEALRGSVKEKPILVLFGLEYAHVVSILKSVMTKSLQSTGCTSALHFADISCVSIIPLKENEISKEHGELSRVASDADSYKVTENNLNFKSKDSKKGKYSLGGLTWSLPEGHKMEDYLLFWIGSDNSAFANVVLTFNGCDIVRFDAKASRLVGDVSDKKKILKRRYYLVEKAKDANIVGILVGTLGIAGYLHMIQRMKELIEGAGKKFYTFVMGRPNPAKVANFPECDIFVYISCAQTALLDSKEFLAPIITPFEAMLAFNRGSQWTGEYIIDFNDSLMSTEVVPTASIGEARFSFLQGGYVEDGELQESGEGEKETSVVLANTMEKALSFETKRADSILFKGAAKTGAEFFAARSYQGLEMHHESVPRSFIMGRVGKASKYEDEKSQIPDA